MAAAVTCMYYILYCRYCIPEWPLNLINSHVYSHHSVFETVTWRGVHFNSKNRRVIMRRSQKRICHLDPDARRRKPLSFKVKSL
jgi:hypothetical protein